MQNNLTLKIVEETLRWAYNNKDFALNHDYKFMYHLSNIIMEVQQKIEE